MDYTCLMGISQHLSGGVIVKELPIGFRRKENGQLEYRFTVDGRRYSVSGATTTECRRKEKEKRQYIAEHGYIENSALTVRQYYDEWMKNRKQYISPSSARNCAFAFKVILEKIGDCRICELDRRKLIRLQMELSEKYCSSTTNYKMGLLRAMLKSAVFDEVISRNPSDGMRHIKRTEKMASETIHRALNVDEEKRFLEAAKGEWLYELYCFLLQTGCRIGEALGLYWSDVDYKAGVIHIRRTVTWTGERYEPGETTKTEQSRRDIPITEGIRKTLRQQRIKVEAIVTNVRSLNDLVFVTPEMIGCLTRNVNYAVSVVAKRAKIDRIAVHCFRDTFATRCIERGMSPQTLKTILGHSSYQMTMDLYAHVLPNTKKEEMEKVDRAL